jgi:uncharacterized protein YacL (UPF0231 family)
MTATIRFYRDQSHQPRVYAEPEHTTLADYLESDLQDVATTREVLQMLDSIDAGAEQEINGNSYTVILQAELITLESLYDDSEKPYQLPTAQWKPLLSAWAEFVDNDNLMSIVPDF